MNPNVLSDPRQDAREFVRRSLFATFAVVFGLNALLLATNTVLPAGGRALLLLASSALGVFSTLAWHWKRLRTELALVVTCGGGMALIAVAAVTHGWGMNGPVIGFLAVLSFLMGATVNARLGIALALTGAALLIALGWAEHVGWIRGAAALADMPLGRRLTNLLILLGVSLSGGLLVHRVFDHYLGASRDREARFRGLLGIAADTYWELDEHFTQMHVWYRDRDNRFLPSERVLKAPWDQPEWEFDPGADEAHYADLRARRPFRNLRARWRMPDGSLRHELISGEPRFDDAGRFLGYWGVTRNVTADVDLQQAMRATEQRYRELFELSPMALVIHRDWRVLDANAAALLMFGHADLEAMKRTDLLATLGPAEQETARARLAHVQSGQRLLPITYRATMFDGRRLTLRVSGTCIERDGPPTVLSIYDDITGLVDAQEALRRSETTLSTLVTTSPDMITLTEVATGRFVMVNETFTRLSGFTREEAIGRTSVELRLWGGMPSREEFVRRLRERGRLQDVPVEFLDKWGRPFTLLLAAALFELEGRSYMVLNGRDVTESERARLAHEAVLENASLGIAFTREGRFVQANPALEKMLGWEPGTLVGQSGRAVWAGDEEYAEIGALIGPPLSRGEPVEFVRELARRDGSMFWCRMLAKAVDPTHPMHGGTIWMVEDITERRRTEQALAKARDDAEAANRAKSAFLANTSHEIRTPLNGLVGLARLARRPDIDEPRRHQYLEQIAESAETLSAIISDVLDLSKIEAGKLAIEHLAFDLRALLESLRQVYGTLADARGLAFAVQVDRVLPQWVWGDPVRVRQVLGNYLNNALKFTAQGTVTLRAGTCGDGLLRFEVCDTGPGISAEVRARLFRPFTQADQSTTRRFGGSGLGLSICRELASLMDGRVGVDSEPGQGSCFWAELRLPATEPPAHDSGFGALEPSPLAGARVLMVEDNAVNMTIAVAMLEQWGVEVEQALDGAQAIAAVEQAARAGRPLDLVLMDVQMPVMSGYEATRALRALPAGRTLPVIALTAAALTSEREQALACGMNGFLTKPIDAQKLHDTLLAALARPS
ncbi:PAS domain S-box protein [uncultured Piscinibacter sp.]|uniref:PAS domain-containing hybrid sensor histidine kinase/response regulator n=1 Tax=uncultured Piscinibacter sp. TaxID=1131835 RepID=UPI0026388227|nr:PAS domain S-box protein [uncultured Piscinibacter sp.]